VDAERYPADLVVELKDFETCDWLTAVSGSSSEGYPSMWQALSSAARQAIEENRYQHAKVLWLLADSCSMMLNPDSINAPFSPIMVTDGKRTAIPGDFSNEDILYLSQIVDKIDDKWLRARVADIVWLRNRSVGVRFPLIAIDSYRSIGLDSDAWIRGGKECWIRAIHLCRLLKGGAGQRINEIEAQILDSFYSCSNEDGLLAYWLAELLKENGLASKSSADIAERMENHAKEYDRNGELYLAREYYEASENWFNKEGNGAKSAEMWVSVAECWVKEAINRTSSEQPSHMVAANCYEHAIQVYRTIPRSERRVHRVDERISEIYVHLRESGEKSLGELSLVSTESVDISQIVERAKNSVQGKEPLEALKFFSNLHHGARAQELRESAVRQIQKHPLHGLVAATVISRDGRVIAKRPGMSFDGESSGIDEIVIRSEMIKNFEILTDIIVTGSILPALDVLLVEHYWREVDLINIVRQSPIVPRDRTTLFGKALYAGFNRDFVVAVHLLVPQIENMVRFHLKSSGVKTTNLDINGIENENGLSTLMDIPEVVKIFGADIAFEIKALFCDSFGPNLRNELAHGLLNASECYSVHVVYAWWFGLRIVFNTFWNAFQKDDNNVVNKHASGGQAG